MHGQLKTVLIQNKVNSKENSVSDQAAVVHTLDSAIHKIKIYPMNSTIVSPNTFPLDSDLSGG